MSKVNYTVPGFWDLYNGKKSKPSAARKKTRCSAGHVHISERLAAECDERNRGEPK